MRDGEAEDRRILSDDKTAWRVREGLKEPKRDSRGERERECEDVTGYRVEDESGHNTNEELRVD